jgi:hypothetical protein
MVPVNEKSNKEKAILTIASTIKIEIKILYTIT